MMILFTTPGCSHCSNVVIPEELDVEIVVCDENYKGLTPDNYPLLLTDNDLKLNGSVFINKFLHCLNKAKDGLYSKQRIR